MRIEEIIGMRMKQCREALGMTQQQLGDELGYLLERPWPKQAVSAAEKGNRAFAAVELLALADCLEVTCSELLSPLPSMHEVQMPSGWFISTHALIGEGPDQGYPPIVRELIELLEKDQYKAQDALVSATKSLAALTQHLDQSGPVAASDEVDEVPVVREPSAAERAAGTPDRVKDG